MARQPFAQPLRGSMQAVAGLVAVALVAMPAAVVGLSASVSADALWTALRIAGLEAFIVIFASIVTGSFRPFFNRLAKPRLIQRVHTVTGIVGFSLAVAHGVCVVVFGTAGYRLGPLWAGPAALAVLAAAIATALLRPRFKGSWRWVHRLNHAVFFAVLVHGLALGTDVRSSLFLKVWVGICAAVVLAGLAYRYARPARLRGSNQRTGG